MQDLLRAAINTHSTPSCQCSDREILQQLYLSLSSDAHLDSRCGALEVVLTEEQVNQKPLRRQRHDSVSQGTTANPTHIGTRELHLLRRSATLILLFPKQTCSVQQTPVCRISRSAQAQD